MHFHFMTVPGAMNFTIKVGDFVDIRIVLLVFIKYIINIIGVKKTIFKIQFILTV